MRENVISQRATSSPSALLRAGGAAAMLALPLVGGCVVYPAGRVAGSVGEVYVDVAPPAPLYEPVPISPDIGFI